jgi:heme/copper-type cytochrome/quinol oxidase subunit 1
MAICILAFLHWAVGFMVTFVIGGMTGVLMAVPPADFLVHNSLFLVAHFHNVAIGAVLFGAFAGYNYWFPKAFGFRLDERLGKAAFWCWFVGFYVSFVPLYAVGLLGMTRRLQHYAACAAGYRAARTRVFEPGSARVCRSPALSLNRSPSCAAPPACRNNQLFAFHLPQY